MQQQEGELRRRGPLTRSRKARMLTQQDAKPASRTALADLSNANNRTDATKKKKKLTVRIDLASCLPMSLAEPLLAAS